MLLKALPVEKKKERFYTLNFANTNSTDQYYVGLQQEDSYSDLQCALYLQ